MKEGKKYDQTWLFKQISHQARIFKILFDSTFILRFQIEDFKPLLPTYNGRGDLEFLIKVHFVKWLEKGVLFEIFASFSKSLELIENFQSNDTADAIRTISRRIVHRGSGDRIVFNVERATAPWQRLKRNEIDAINVSHFQT